MSRFFENINYSVLKNVLDNFTKGRARELWNELKKTNLPLKKKIWIYLQARHETGGFRKYADSSYNYFGIKYADWMSEYGVSKTNPIWTFEYESGKYIPQKSYFAKFNSAKQALSIYLKLQPVKRALQESETAEEYFKNLRKYGYYTAPYTHYYAGILRSIAELEKYA